MEIFAENMSIFFFLDNVWYFSDSDPFYSLLMLLLLLLLLENFRSLLETAGMEILIHLESFSDVLRNLSLVQCPEWSLVPSILE